MDETNKGYMKHLGGLELKQISETQYEFIVEVKEMHLNTGKIAHGGFLATIADTGMGTAAHRVAGDKRCVTINLDMKFISAGMLGDKLNWKGEAKKSGIQMGDIINNFKIENPNRPSKAIIYPFAFMLLIVFGFLNFKRSKILNK